jgi:hypothetical protein
MEKITATEDKILLEASLKTVVRILQTLKSIYKKIQGFLADKPSQVHCRMYLK